MILRFRRAVTLLAALGLLAAGAAGAAQQGPAGSAFYTPPRSLPGAVHGDLIRWRALRTGARLPAAARNLLILYRSTSLGGRPIAVSGTVAIPRGKPPKHGWPVISWAHGTAGVADTCAPSLDAPGRHATGDIPYTNVLLNQWVKAGYVVLRTDYEGLGVPGPHPFGVGHSEGRGVIDIVRAARQLDHRIGRRWIAAGHSQGGQAALFAAADAARWAPELQLRGAVAFAPLNHISDLFRLAAAVRTPSGISAYGGLFTAGIDSVDPKLHLRRGLTPKARALYPQLGRKCLDALYRPSSWGSLAPHDVFEPGHRLQAAEAYLDRHAEAGALTIRVPIQIEQGDSDTTVFKAFTDKLTQQLMARHARVDYRVYSGTTHHGVLAAGWPSATAFAAARLR